MTTLASALRWIKKEHGGVRIRAKAIILAFSIMVHEIWRARNSLAFEEEAVVAETIVARVKLATYHILSRTFPGIRITF
ncbi:hypothetical protein LIER_19178 [Lithospermum erythrorhizon]|uniref:Uncharacterized protein n=1 Tax=Lithospermum erythrorhizon TaxID=34254 RepID=A0AAV3QJG4_LITER